MPRIPKRKALVIGINYDKCPNPGYGTLHYSRKDAWDFSKLLIDVCHFAKDDVTIMLDEEGYISPTRKNIVDQIRNLVKGAQAEDTFVFYYAGHSDQIPCNEHTEDDDMDEVILPVDHQGTDNEKKLIIDNLLRKLLVNPLPSRARLTAIFDTCHSGTLLDLDHYNCNTMYHPWISKGQRDVKPRHRDVVRRNDTDREPSNSLQRTFSKRPKRAGTADGFFLALGQSAKKLAKKPSVSFKRAETSLSTVSLRGRSFIVNKATKLWRLLIPKCASPDSWYKCDGYCAQSPTEKPHIISISACNDAQSTWESGRKGSMTQAFIAELSKERTQPLRLGELYTALSHNRYSVSCRLHSWSKKEEQKAEELLRAQTASNTDGSDATVSEEKAIEMVNFSDVQFGSQEKLDLEEIFCF